jgi:hypothetical protein
MLVADRPLPDLERLARMRLAFRHPPSGCLPVRCRHSHVA